MLRIALLLATICYATVTAPPSLAEVDYAGQVRPILARKCFACHGPDQQEGGVRFDKYETLVAPADSGQTPIVAFRSSESELMTRVASEDASERMPPDGSPLSDDEISLLRAWIDEGAEFSNHWAFQPVVRVHPPNVTASVEATGPIDLFVIQKLENANVDWVPRASIPELVRRTYLDVVGLPPSPETLTQWVENWQADSYEQLIDQLLADPSLGERWARMWLDVVRYAESNSFERDNPKPNAWRYRDYVINAFNSDKSYRQFVVEQLAGDELDEVNLETLTATGYYRLGIWDDEPADPLQAVFDEYDDIVSTTGQAFLGLTLGCARCHDHKIDPITQIDYYSLLAFVRDVTPYALRNDQESNNQLDLYPERVLEHKRYDGKIRRLSQKLTKLEQNAIEKMPGEMQRATEGEQRKEVLEKHLRDFMEAEDWLEYSGIRSELHEAIQSKSELPERVTTLGLARLNADPPQTFVLLRGSPHNEGDPVVPTFPELLGGGSPELPPIDSSSHSAGRRRLLAEWMASDDNWLTARVMVNRIWHHYFGRGIVRSPNNFGLMGDPPTHPELLDYLACELMDHGWSLKHIHRQILLSAVYQRSSMVEVDSARRDPENNLLWRQNLKRLSAEQVRDSVLAVSGQINLLQFGPPMYPDLSAEVLASQSQPGRNWEKSSPSEQARRSVYIHVKRSLPVPLLSVFDFPDSDMSCEARFLTTQPSQALTMLNSLWMQKQAQALLERLQREVGDDLHLQAKRCLELVLCRPVDNHGPESQDVKTLVQLVQRLKVEEKLSDEAARRNMCLVALNLNHFIYLD